MMEDGAQKIQNHLKVLAMFGGKNLLALKIQKQIKVLGLLLKATHKVILLHNKSPVLASIATKKATYHENAQTKLAHQIAHQEVMDASNVARKGTYQENVQSKTARMTEPSLQAKVTRFTAVISA